MAAETLLVVCVDKMAGTINIKMKKKILEIHSEWLKQNGYKKEYKDCVKQITKLKRTCVHAMPRASLCTTTYEAASTVEVWSLCSPGSTCTETRGVDMIKYFDLF